jgi:uncharacterized protein (DUF58 family)
LSYLGGFIGAVLGFVMKLAILALIVNTIGGGWGMVLLCGLALVIYYAVRRFGRSPA